MNVVSMHINNITLFNFNKIRNKFVQVHLILNILLMA